MADLGQQAGGQASGGWYAVRSLTWVLEDNSRLCTGTTNCFGQSRSQPMSFWQTAPSGASRLQYRRNYSKPSPPSRAAKRSMSSRRSRSAARRACHARPSACGEGPQLRVRFICLISSSPSPAHPPPPESLPRFFLRRGGELMVFTPKALDRTAQGKRSATP